MKLLFFDITQKGSQNYGFHKNGNNANNVTVQVSAYGNFIKLQGRRSQKQHCQSTSSGPLTSLKFVG